MSIKDPHKNSKTNLCVSEEMMMSPSAVGKPQVCAAWKQKVGGAYIMDTESNQSQKSESLKSHKQETGK